MTSRRTLRASTTRLEHPQHEVEIDYTTVGAALQRAAEDIWEKDVDEAMNDGPIKED